MDDSETILFQAASEGGFRIDGLRTLMGLIHGMSMRRSFSGETAHLPAAEVVGVLFASALERFGPLARDVLTAWGLDHPARIGAAVDLLVQGGLLSRSPEEEGEEDFDDLPPPPDDWPIHPAPPPMREITMWGAG
jgi:uncharacterized repeat protein (TIGR04138 family)